MDYINNGLRSYTIILFISTLTFIAGSNVNCNGKAFHCVNSTHFKICVDLGGGVSTTVDEFLIPCPRNTVCKQYNLFECEYELTTTLPPVTAQNEVTNEQFQTSVNSVWKQLDITTIFPTKQQQGMELSDNNYNKVNTTPANFTSSFDRSSSDAVIDPVTSSTTKDLNTSTNSNINKTLNIFLRIDKELAFSTTESGIDTAQKLPYNVGTTLGTDIGVSNNYNTEISTTLDRKTIDSIKSISSKALNQNSFDLNTTLMVTERTNQVSGVLELPYSTTVKLLPGNLSDSYLQENIPRKSNITNMIKSDNMSQERNLDPSIIYNKTQINNNTQYRNTNNDKLNSKTRNDITDEKFFNDVSHKNSKVNSVITLELTTQNLAEATTSSYPTYLNTSDAIETFLNEGINITTNLEKLSVTDGDVISTSIIPESSVVKTNKTSSPTTNFGLNVGVSNIALTNPILEVQTASPSNKPQSLEKTSLNLTNWAKNLNMENISLYLTTTEPYLIHERNDILPISSTLKSEITSEVNIGEVIFLSANEATQVRNGSQIDNLNYMENELVNNQSNPSFLPLSNISLYTVTPVTKTETYDKITVGDYNFKGVEMLPVLTTTEILNEVTSLKPIPDLISKNETWQMPAMMADLDNNNISTTKPSNNITAEILNVVKILKPLSDLISKNETVVVIGNTDLHNNNTTTEDPSNSITAEISNGVTSLRPSSVLISTNETWQKPLMVTVPTDLKNTNRTTTKLIHNNIIADISNDGTILKPLSDLISNNETWQMPIMTTVATDLDNKNITSTEPSNNITQEISNGVTSLKPLLDLISNNETWQLPIMTTVATDLDNKNITSIEPSNNITPEIPNVVTILKPLSDLISKNETVVVIGNIDFHNNNTTTEDPSNSITAEISNGVTSLKPSSVLISTNETWQKPLMVTVPTDLKNTNRTTTELIHNNIIADISNDGTILKPLSDLISNNETWQMPIMTTFATDLDTKNITSTGPRNNFTPEISKGVTSLKPLSDLISKNENWRKPIMTSVATDLDNNNITTAEPSNNIAAEISNGITIMKPLSDLISKNDTVVMVGNTDLDNNNTTTADPSNNITAEISNEATNLSKSHSVSHIISTTSKMPSDFKLLMVTDTSDSFHKDNILVTTTALFTDHHTLNEATTTLSSLTKISDYIFMTKNLNTDLGGLISSIGSVTSDVKLNITSNTTGLPTTSDEPTTFLDRNSNILDKNNTTYNNDITKPVHNTFGSISTFIKKISDVYETRTESYTVSTMMESLTGTAAIKPANSMDVINNTFAVIDELADYTVNSDNNKSIDNASKLESTIMAKPSTFFVSNTSGEQSNSSETKNVTVEPSESTKKEMNKLRGINKNTSNNDEVLDNNGAMNLNLSTPSTKHIIIPKLLTVITDFGISPAFIITNLSNNIVNKNNTITDNSIINNSKDIEVIHNKVINNLDEKSLIVNGNNINLNYTYTNKSSSVSSYSKSLPNSLIKPLLTDMYKVSPRNFGENISLTRTLDKTTPSNKNNEKKELSQSIKNEHAAMHTIKNMEHEGNKTEYQQLIPYKKVTTTAIDVNDSTRTLKEISYNFSQPSSIVRNNVKHIFFMENVTMTSADKNTTPKDFNDKEGSGFNKSYSTTNKLINVNDYKNHSELADYFPLSGISNNQPSGYVIKPLLIEQKPLVKVSKSSLHNDNENLGLITEHKLQGHVSDRINKSKISEISNVNRSEHIAPVKNITSSNWGVVNKRVVAKPTKTFTYYRNVSEVKGLSVPRNRDNYPHDLNATSDSSFTTNNLLRNTSSQTYSNNKTHQVLSNLREFSRLPADQDKSKMDTTPLVLKIPKLELFSKPDKVTVSEPPRVINTNRSNGIDEKQLRNEHGSLESNKIGKGVPKNIENNTKSSFTTPINNVNNTETKCGNTPSKQEFTCTNRGKYSDANDCNKFYVCIGRIKPVVGVCPTGTVFSEYLKQCTKNITHCIRNNQFKCTAAGRFIHILSNNTYFVCAKKKSSFIRFTLQCQKGYYLDKYSIKCTPNLRNISLSDESKSNNTKELSFHKEIEEVSVKSKDVFECEKEGKFKDPQDCKKYYICKKGRRSTFRRKIKQCDSDEVFHRKKKKCVDVESYECDI